MSLGAASCILLGGPSFQSPGSLCANGQWPPEQSPAVLQLPP